MTLQDAVRPCARRRGRMRQAAWLGLGAAAASAPTAVGLALLRGAHPHLGPRTAWSFLAIGLAVQVAAAFGLRRRVPLAPPRRALLAALTVQMLVGFAHAQLARAAPFRLGLLSAALYALPALLYARALFARTRCALTGWLAAATAVPLALAPLLAALQRHVAAAQWIAAQGIPDRALLQRVDLPGLSQEPYRHDQASGQVTALLDWTPDWMLGPVAVAAETVTPGANPCAPALFAAGDAANTRAPADCAPVGDGLWDLHDADPGDNDVGFAAVRGEVTVTLTGAPADAAALRAALLHTRPASDGDLWSRQDPGPVSLLDWIVL